MTSREMVQDSATRNQRNKSLNQCFHSLYDVKEEKSFLKISNLVNDWAVGRQC